MPSQHITLAYHLENQKFAQQLEKCFAKTDVQYEHLICKEGTFSPTFNDTLKKETNQILLLLSDNYLKSQAAMSEALPTFQHLFGQQKITILVIDGINEKGKNTPTEFDRIGQLIKYMNFWQDHYLELRQRGRMLGEIDDALELETKKVREISTNIGELLRYLRDQSLAQIRPILEDEFKSFNNFYKINGPVETNFLVGYVQEQTAPQPASAPTEKVESTVPRAKDPSIAVSESAKTEPVMPQAKADTNQPIVDNIEVPPIDLSAIPGMSMLDKKAKLQQEVNPSVEENKDPDFPEVKEKIVEHKIEKVEKTEKVKLPKELTDNLSQAKPENTPVAKKKFSIPTFLDDFSGAKEKTAEKPEPKQAPKVDVNAELKEIEKHIQEVKFSEAKKQLEKLSGEFPKEARIWKNLGVIAEQESDNILASTHYSRALELDPTLPDLDFKVGLINSHYYPDQIDRSIQYFENSIAKDPNHFESYYQLGILNNEGKGNATLSIPIFERVLEINPEHEFANYDLALIYFNKGDKESALDYYCRAFKNNAELQTPENDQAFGFMTEKVNVEKVVEPSAADPVLERPFVDKTVLITGATSGIGKATATAFAKAGYRVVLTGRRADRLKELSKALRVFNSKVQYLSFDVRDVKSSEEALNNLATPYSDIDLLINNAGLASGLDPIQSGDPRDWDKMIDTNIKGILYMTRLISPQMVERKTGHIINICSTAGHEVYPKGNVYCATKHAVDALTKGMRLDLHSFGIKVSQVSPAAVEETEFAKVRFHGDTEKAKIYEDFNPLKSSDVAQSILFIASQPPHVNIQDILLMGTQQASSTVVDRTGRKYD